jgi:hypothetical protein
MIEAAAIAWYTPAAWRQLQDVAGADTLCTYGEFTRKTEAILCGFRAEGIAAEKVTIDVGHMSAWCKHHRYPIGAASSRSAYGGALAVHGGKLFDIENTPFDDGGFVSRRQ